MEREQILKRMRDHPVTEALERAAAGQPVHEEDLQACNLPKTVERAMRQALEQVQASQAPREAQELSYELIDALGEEHETLQEQRERKAQYGDADALAALQAQEQAHRRQMDAILKRRGAVGR